MLYCEPYLSMIVAYSTVSILNGVIFIGGFGNSGEGLDVVAMFKEDQWSRLPNLRQNRNSHGSMRIGKKTVVIGGWNTRGDPEE